MNAANDPNHTNSAGAAATPTRGTAGDPSVVADIFWETRHLPFRQGYPLAEEAHALPARRASAEVLALGSYVLGAACRFVIAGADMGTGDVGTSFSSWLDSHRGSALPNGGKLDFLTLERLANMFADLAKETFWHQIMEETRAKVDENLAQRPAKYQVGAQER